MTGLWLVSYIALWLLFLLIAAVLLSILRNLGVIFEQLSQLQPKRSNLEEGQALPEVVLRTPEGETVSTSEWRGTATAFAIISPGCGPCHDYLEQLATDDTVLHLPDATVPEYAILSLGDAPQTQELLQSLDRRAELERFPLLLDTKGQIMDMWGIAATPTTVVVDEQMTVTNQLFGLHKNGRA